MRKARRGGMSCNVIEEEGREGEDVMALREVW